MRRSALVLLFVSIGLAPRLSSETAVSTTKEGKGPRFEISFPSSLQATAITGRVFLAISKKGEREPRLQGSALLFGVDVEHQKPGDQAIIDENTLGYPLKGLKDIPSGDYFVQAILNV